jgi:hypothetical protein
MNFGKALEAMKSGERVSRAGWNGKNMWIAYSPGSRSLPAKSFWSGPNKRFAEDEGGGFAPVLPCITMKTVGGEILMGWIPSQTDMLSEDWGIVP